MLSGGSGIGALVEIVDGEGAGSIAGEARKVSRAAVEALASLAGPGGQEGEVAGTGPTAAVFRDVSYVAVSAQPGRAGHSCGRRTLRTWWCPRDAGFSRIDKHRK